MWCTFFMGFNNLFVYQHSLSFSIWKIDFCIIGYQYNEAQINCQLMIGPSAQFAKIFSIPPFWLIRAPLNNSDFNFSVT